MLESGYARTHMHKPLKVLVVGAGNMACAAHLPILRSLAQEGEVELVSVCDVDIERAHHAKQSFGFTHASTDPKAEIVRADIDCVYLFAYAQVHYELGLYALAHNKHVFIEKPIAPSAELAEGLVSAAAEHGCVAVGGLNRRFSAPIRRIVEMGGLGAWQRAHVVFNKPALGKAPPFGARTWLTANAIHALDALVYLSGSRPTSLAALARAREAAEPNIFTAVIAFENGAQATFISDNSAPERIETYEFSSSSHIYKVHEELLTVVSNDGAEETIRYTEDDRGFVEEHKAFLHAIRTNEEPVHALKQLVPALRIAECIEDGYSGPFGYKEVRDHNPNASVAVTGGTIAFWGSGPAAQTALKKLIAHFEVVPIGDGSDPRLLTSEFLFIAKGAPELPRALMDRLPRIKVVGVPGLSLKKYTPEEFIRRGAVIVNASEAYSDTVAELALAFAILGRRKAVLSHEAMRSGGWGTTIPTFSISAKARATARHLRGWVARTPFFGLAEKLWRAAQPVLGPGNPVRPGPHSLYGATVGIIGWGEGARSFARKLKPFSVRIIVTSEHVTDAECTEFGIQRGRLDEALQSDIVSLHRGLTEKTKRTLGPNEFSKLRAGAVFINVARGELVDTDALVARLQKGDVQAYLDVFDSEPLPARHPLRFLKNVFLTSHIAGGTKELHERAIEEVIRKFVDLAANKAVSTIQTLERLRSMT